MILLGLAAVLPRSGPVAGLKSPGLPLKYTRPPVIPNVA